MKPTILGFIGCGKHALQSHNLPSLQIDGFSKAVTLYDPSKFSRDITEKTIQLKYGERISIWNFSKMQQMLMMVPHTTMQTEKK